MNLAALILAPCTLTHTSSYHNRPLMAVYSRGKSTSRYSYTTDVGVLLLILLLLVCTDALASVFVAAFVLPTCPSGETTTPAVVPVSAQLSSDVPDGRQLANRRNRRKWKKRSGEPVGVESIFSDARGLFRARRSRRKKRLNRERVKVEQDRLSEATENDIVDIWRLEENKEAILIRMPYK